MNACTAFLGYSAGLYLNEGQDSLFRDDLYTGILVLIAVFFLSGGAAALNNYQDRHLDTQIKRTRLRPIPMKKVSAGMVLAISFTQIVFSLGALAMLSHSIFAAATALAAVLIYNGLYTPLKKRTLYAMIPGILCGAMPPIIGWVATGVPISSSVLFYIVAALALWQIPHYWLLLLSNKLDFSNRLLPSFANYFSYRELAVLSCFWIICYSLIILLIPLFIGAKINSPVWLNALFTIVIGYALSLIAASFFLLIKGKRKPQERNIFVLLNASSVVFAIFLSGYFCFSTYS